MNFELASLDLEFEKFVERIEQFKDNKSEYSAWKMSLEDIRNRLECLHGIRNYIFKAVEEKMTVLKRCRAELKEIKDELFSHIPDWSLPEHKDGVVNAIDFDLDCLEDNLETFCMYTRCLFEYSHFLLAFRNEYSIPIAEEYAKKICDIQQRIATPCGYVAARYERETFWKHYIQLHKIFEQHEDIFLKSESKLFQSKFQSKLSLQTK